MDNNTNKKKRRFPIWATVLCIILAVILLIGVGVFAFIQIQLSKINKYDPDDVVVVAPEDESFETDDYKDGVEVVDPDDIIWPDDIEWEEDENIVMSSADVTNILLIGQDTRIDGARARSDSMMILTLNSKNKTIKVTSLMRDLYVQIPGYSDNRINAAYSFGGYPLLKSTIEKNFGVRIDYFVEVNFFAFTKIVDIVGGVYMDLNAAEAAYMKNLGHRTVEGRNRLDGDAALTFCQMRYVGNSDYERTDRQRRTLNAIYQELRATASISTILELVDEILPLVTTNMTNGELISMATSLYTMNIGAVQQYRIPHDGAYTPMYVRGMAVLVPDLVACREYLQGIIYGE